MDFGIRMRWLFSCSPHQIVDSSRGLFLFLCFLQSWQIDVLMSTWAEWSNHFRIRTAILCFALFLVAWIGCFASFSAFKPLRDIYALIPLRWINYLVSYEIEFTNCNTTNRMRRYSFRGYFTASEFQDWHYATYFRLSQMRTGFPPFFAISKSRRFFWFISWKTRYSPFKPATQKKKLEQKHVFTGWAQLHLHFCLVKSQLWIALATQWGVFLSLARIESLHDHFGHE